MDSHHSTRRIVSVRTKQLGGIALIATLIFAISAFLAGSAGAQSGGCTGTFAGATALDSDGDGVSDAVETQTGTDVCDPGSVPSLVCGEYISGYDAANFDADNDGVSDADETAAGTDPCDAASVAGATSTQTTTAVSPAVAEPPLLALTGPSTATVLVIVAMLLVGLGAASVVVGKSVDS